jgi:Zn finger protein HypA/HybF involved in hydrogenase expression
MFSLPLSLVECQDCKNEWVEYLDEDTVCSECGSKNVEYK